MKINTHLKGKTKGAKKGSQKEVIVKAKALTKGTKWHREDKERITKNRWQVVVARRRKTLPATPATHVESPKHGLQTRNTRETTLLIGGPR